MNLSGKAVKYWRDKENIPVENLLVGVDDLALPLERLRIRGGAGVTVDITVFEAFRNF